VTGSLQLLDQLHEFRRIVFDLDGTLYDTRDFEHPALAAVVVWLSRRTAKPLDGLLAALLARRDADRHKPGLFDELLPQHGLPAAWGAECAARFHSYAGTELGGARNLGDELGAERAFGLSGLAAGFAAVLAAGFAAVRFAAGFAAALRAAGLAATFFAAGLAATLRAAGFAATLRDPCNDGGGSPILMQTTFRPLTVGLSGSYQF